MRSEPFQEFYSLVYTFQPTFMRNPVVLQVRRRGEVQVMGVSCESCP